MILNDSNDSKVIVFTRNHTDDNTDYNDDGTKKKMSPPGSGLDIISCNYTTSHQEFLTHQLEDKESLKEIRT